MKTLFKITSFSMMLLTSFSVNAQYNAGTGSGTVGDNCTFVGINAGRVNTGANNSFFGQNVGFLNTTGSSNTFIGSVAGRKNTTGTFNTFNGHAAGYENTIGMLNTFSGYSAGFRNTTGNGNTFTGHTVGYANTTGGNNTYIGQAAGRFNKTANNNTFIGYQTGYKVTSGNNTMLGFRAGFNAAGAGNVFVGYTAGYNEAGNNKLYIDNSPTANPLIKGDFAANTLTFNGKVSQRIAGVLGGFGPNDKWSSLGDSPANNIYGMLNRGYGATFVSGSKAGANNIIGFSGSRLDFDVIGAGGPTTTRVSILSNGNMGIGTTAPTAKLDVVGTLRVRNIPDGGIHMVTVDGNGNFMKQPIPGDGGGGVPDGLGDHCAMMDLDMKGFDIKNVKDIKGIGNLNMNASGDININSGDFLYLDATNGINVNSKFFPLLLNDIHKQSVGIGGEPNGIPGELNVALDVHRNQYDAPLRVRNLPFAELPIVTVDHTGVLHQSNYTPQDLMSPPGGGDNLGNHQATEWLNMNMNKIINLDDPIDPWDAVNKAYVDALAVTVNTDAVKDQQNEIENLRKEVADLKELVNTLLNQPTKDINQQNIQLNGRDAYLEQNQPNPFNTNTLIKYNIPENAGQATINIYDAFGKIIHTERIQQTGKGEIQVQAGTIPPGVYTYSLHINERIIDSKQMIISK